MTHNERRRYLRNRPDPNDYAQVDLSDGSESFDSTFVALIVDESPMGGCSLAAIGEWPIEEGKECRVKLGRLEPLVARLVWKRALCDGIVRYGFQFLA